MKRAQFLFSQIVSYENLRTAWLKARRHKGSKRSVISYQKNVEANLNELQEKLLSRDFNFPPYHQFTVYDPKIRTISVVPFDQRVLHHAIINVLEPVFEKQFIFHTYACRKGKGVHKALQGLQNQMRKPELKDGYYIKLDVRKYFENINHRILKIRLSRIIKDSDCLELLFHLIDSFSTEGYSAGENGNSFCCRKGLPIGNLTSQFFANLYLSEFVKDPVINLCRSGINFLGRIIDADYARFSSLKKRRKRLGLQKKQLSYTVEEISDDRFTDECALIYGERII